MSATGVTNIEVHVSDDCGKPVVAVVTREGDNTIISGMTSDTARMLAQILIEAADRVEAIEALQ